jgi:protein SCO1/2
MKSRSPPKAQSDATATPTLAKSFGHESRFRNEPTGLDSYTWTLSKSTCVRIGRGTAMHDAAPIAAFVSDDDGGTRLRCSGKPLHSKPMLLPIRILPIRIRNGNPVYSRNRVVRICGLVKGRTCPAEVSKAMNRLARISRAARNCSGISLAMLLLGLAALVAEPSLNSGRLAYAAAAPNYLPDITLTNQHSASLSLASLRGRPVLVGFIHTMCEGPCALLTAKMQSVTAVLQSKAPRTTMLLITTDPADDQPAELLAYAKKQSLAGKQWVLVTGPHPSVKHLMSIYGVSHDDGDDDTMVHVMKLFLIAPDGSLAHTYSGLNASPQTVANDIRNMSRRGTRARVASSSSIQ